MQTYTIVDAETDLRAALTANDTDEIARLSGLVDSLDKPLQQVSCLAAALWYGEQGLGIFPLQPERKIPHPGTRGCKDATTDPEVIRAWWERWPDSNLGVATGHLVDVVDIDGLVGVKSLLAVPGQLEQLREMSVGMVSTPRAGGQHWYMPHVEGRGNTAGLLDGIDTRGTGGYVVAPPSRTEQGVYRWVHTLDVERLAK